MMFTVAELVSLGALIALLSGLFGALINELLNERRIASVSAHMKDFIEKYPDTFRPTVNNYMPPPTVIRANYAPRRGKR